MPGDRRGHTVLGKTLPCHPGVFPNGEAHRHSQWTFEEPHQLYGRKINPPPGSDFLPWLCKQYHHYSCLMIILSKTLDIQSPWTHTRPFADEVWSLKVPWMRHLTCGNKNKGTLSTMAQPPPQELYIKTLTPLVWEETQPKMLIVFEPCLLQCFDPPLPPTTGYILQSKDLEWTEQTAEPWTMWLQLQTQVIRVSAKV